jgi:hypothetical protein
MKTHQSHVANAAHAAQYIFISNMFVKKFIINAMDNILTLSFIFHIHARMLKFICRR